MNVSDIEEMYKEALLQYPNDEILLYYRYVFLYITHKGIIPKEVILNVFPEEFLKTDKKLELLMFLQKKEITTEQFLAYIWSIINNISKNENKEEFTYWKNLLGSFVFIKQII